MGDRCYMEVNVHPDDAAGFSAIFGMAYQGEVTDEGLRQFVIEEANYACIDEITWAGDARFRFYGWHSEGAEYCGQMFVSIGAGRVYYVDMNPNENIVVRCDENGQPWDYELVNALDYVRERDLFKKLYVKETKNDQTPS